MSVNRHPTGTGDQPLIEGYSERVKVDFSPSFVDKIKCCITSVTKPTESNLLWSMLAGSENFFSRELAPVWLGLLGSHFRSAITYIQ